MSIFGQRQVGNQPLSRLVGDWERSLCDLLTQQNKIGYYLADKVRAAQLFVIRLKLSNSNDLEKTLKLQERIGLELGVNSPRVVRSGPFVQVEIPLPDDLKRDLSVADLSRRGNRKAWPWVTVGQAPTGENVNVNLASSNYCHGLIAGTTGSGKTVAAHLLAWSLAANNDTSKISMILIDGKGDVDWFGFKNLAHLETPLILDGGQAVRALAWTLREVMQRSEQGRNTPALFVIVDELYELIQKEGDVVAQLVRRITSRGRSAGVHFIGATQHPLSDAVGGSIVKANLPMRMVGRVTSARDAVTATGRPKSGAEQLLGKGDFYIGKTRVQIARVDNRYFDLLQRNHNGARCLDLDDLDPHLIIADSDGDGSIYIEPEPVQRSSNVPDELDPEHVAYALAMDVGINKLARHFGIGNAKAKRSIQFARELAKSLEFMGVSPPARVGVEAG